MTLGFKNMNITNQGDGCNGELTRLIAKENWYTQGFLVAFQVTAWGNKTTVGFDENDSNSTAFGGFCDFVRDFCDL